MDIWLWILLGICLLVIFFLLIRLFLIKKSIREIETAYVEKVHTDTNTLIDLSSRDRSLRNLADSINRHLKQVNRDRRRFQQGDQELKETITNISHDLRTPLTAIRGYLDLLKREPLSFSAQRYLALIENRTSAMTQLTEELFRYSIAVSVPEEPTETLILNRVLEECIASHYGAMKQKQITPDISIPERRIERRLNYSALSRIFGNILENALKYSTGDLQIRMDPDGKIVISNTAEGLTPVLAGRLFDRFYTVETGRKSTGLGLSIAKLLTEQMGGSITAEYRDKTLSILLSFPE